MGDTIYWYRDKSVDQASWNNILQDFTKLCPEINDNRILLAGQNGYGQPIINDQGVSFNGSCRSQGCCEAFNFMRDLVFIYREPRKRHDKYFQFVKTDGLPYGSAVAAFLIIAKHYLNAQIIVNSDTPSSIWDKPKEWCQSILGYGSEFLPEKDDEN
jgi:hypothetical protein